MNSLHIPESLVAFMGLIAFFQVTFFPGWITTKLLGLNRSVIKRLVFSFGLSLMFNYFVVFILAATKTYTATSVIIIILVEIILTILIYKDKLTSICKSSVADIYNHLKKKITVHIHGLTQWLSSELSDSYKGFFVLTALSLALISIFYLIYLFLSNIGTVYNLWDPIVSWNRWAAEFSTNGLPRNTWEYPQLIPTNWSVFYVLTGTSVQYFSKAIMPLFPLGMVLALFISGWRRKNIGFMWAIPAIVVLMRILNGSAIMATEGYVDTAVAFFSFISMMILVSSDQGDDLKKKMQCLVMGGLFAIGAAMTKQAGLYITILYPLVAWFTVVKEDSRIEKKAYVKYFLGYIALALLLLAPFYISKEISISSHSDQSVLPQITSLVYNNSVGHVAQIIASFKYIILKAYYLPLLSLIFVAYAMKKRKIRYITLLVTIPYALIWAIFFSYDTRNLSLALPLWGLATGMGIEQMFDIHRIGIERTISRFKSWWFIVIVIFVLLALSPFVSKKIISQYQADERQIYNNEISLLMSSYFENNPEGKIYTNLPILYFLPATKNRIWSPYGEYDPNRNDFSAWNSAHENSDISYIFAADFTSQDIKQQIEQKITQKHYTVIFRDKDGILVKINRP